MQFNVTVLNLFNTRNSNNVFSTYNAGNGISYDEAKFYAGGFNFEQLASAQGVIKDPRFLKPNGFQAPIQARFGVKLTF